jgi:DNA gyrase subunit A
VDVITRRTIFDLKKTQDRAHILEGLKVATDQDNIDRIIAIIRSSRNEAEAKERLTQEPFWVDQIALLGIADGSDHFEFHLSDQQAQAIIDMRLGRLSGLEQEKISNEYDELEQKISEFHYILENEQHKLDVVKKELLEIKAVYGDERRTEIAAVADEIDIEDLIEEQDCTYTLTRFGYMKRTPTSAYRAQRRGGRGVTAMTTREEDYTEIIFTASTHAYVLFFSNIGKVYRLKGYQIPETGRQAKGMNIVNLLEIEPEEKITAMLPCTEIDEDKYLVFITYEGVIKRCSVSEFQNIRKGGLKALNLNEHDALVNVLLTDGKQNIILGTHEGRAITFAETEARAMGRAAVGVRSMRLAPGDYVVGAAVAEPDKFVLSVTENGYSKRTRVEEFTVHHRGGSGITLHNLTEKTGKIAGLAVVDDTEDVMSITSDGVIIRTPAKDIRICGRSSQGVIMMRTGEDVKVIEVTKTAHEEEEEAESAETDSAETLEETSTEEEI